MKKRSIIKKKNKFGDITISILEEIARIAEIAVEGVLNPYELKRKAEFDILDSERFFNRLRSIHRTGYIEISKDSNGQTSVKLTNKGRIKLLENNPDLSRDGKWRIISFDIPERLKNKRNTFRRIIKKIGFKQIQKSLWICPYNKSDQIELVINELKINQYVAYFIAEKTDINDYLLSKFQ